MNLKRFLDRPGNLLIKDGNKNWVAILSLFFIILLPILFLGSFSYWRTHQDLTRIVLSQRRDVAYLTAITLKEKLDRLTDLSVSLASRVRFAQLVRERKWDEAIQLLNSVNSVPKDFPLVERSFVADIDGNLMADNPALPGVRGKNFAFRDWYRGVKENCRVGIELFRCHSRSPDARVRRVRIFGPVSEHLHVPKYPGHCVDEQGHHS